MVVSITNSANSSMRAYSGTIQEIIDQIEADQVPEHKILSIFWNGSAYVAVVRRR